MTSAKSVWLITSRQTQSLGGTSFLKNVLLNSCKQLCFKVWYSLKHGIMHNETLHAVQPSVFAFTMPPAQFAISLRPPFLGCCRNKGNLIHIEAPMPTIIGVTSGPSWQWNLDCWHAWTTVLIHHAHSVDDVLLERVQW